ncbi:surface-adhesin E family protein [Ralstonia solanacearum]|uniref:surface-adhesin E family protein n=1 Tax=Ralstonia solanacearum TaxID=305 RepID=UPI000181690F|nr:surface-adhesin E family protein [Ralstonia solanacearum]MDC6177368.1 hypothetical protein [Ralstonia solanacearum]MDC6240024.1 hypothetical protein [Ralstonia solanacearum]
MKKSLWLLAVVVAWGAAKAAPPVWMPISDLPNAKRSLDVANIVSRGSMRDVWLRDDPVIPAGLFDMARTWNYPNPNDLDYELTLTRFDCEARMTYTLSMFLYGKGQVVRSVDNGSPGVPSPVVPGSVGDMTYSVVCRPPALAPSTKKRARVTPM